MYKTGDRVKFLNHVGGGVVTKVVGNNTVYVEDEDGFEIPVVISDIIPDQGRMMPDEGFSPVRRDTREEDAGGGLSGVRHSSSTEPALPSPQREAGEEEADIFYVDGKDEPSFYLAFVPDNSNNPVDGETKVFLVNDSNFFLLYHYSHFDGKQYITREAGKLEPNMKLYLESVSQADIDKLPAYMIHGIWFAEKGEAPASFSIKIDVNPIKFYKGGSFAVTSFFKGKAMLFKLCRTDMDNALTKLTDKHIKAGASDKDTFKSKATIGMKQPSPELVEVDLHIQELLDDTRGLANKDMLDCQMKKFREQMDMAIADKAVKRIVFIHGVGNGVLKQELCRELKYKYKKYTFQDASFQEYGFGATLVILRK